MQNLHISKRGMKVEASPIRKLVPYADEAKKRGIKVYHINIGQPDIPTPPFILKAMRDFSNPVLPYGPSQGLLKLREEISKYFKRYGVDIDPCEIFITSGGSEAIFFVFLTTMDEGDEVLIPEPYYTNYNGFANMAGVDIVPIPTDVKEGFHLPEKGVIERLITKKTRAILLCSPNNPTGAVYTKEEYEMIKDLAEKYNLYIISDEVYREFIFNGTEPYSVLKLDTNPERLIVIDSISKRFSACGARIGFIATKNKKILTNVLKYGQARLCPPTIEQYGAIEGYRRIDEFLPRMIEEYRKRRDAAFSVIEEHADIFALKPDGAFYAVLKLPVKDADHFAKWLLSDFNLDGKTVMVAPAKPFYRSPDKGHDEVRIAYVLESDLMREALHILVEGLKEYKRRGFS